MGISNSRSSKRKKKHSQKHSKKSKSKSTREKTKKIKRRHDSDSSRDEDVASKSLSSSSGGGSEDVYKSKKRVKSRDKNDRKSRKKRSKRDRSISESSGESPRIKKRKKSKSSKDSNLRKKKRKKMQTREPSISRSSCERDNASGREFERDEKKLETKKRKGREMSRERSASKSRHSSRSCSPYSLKSRVYYSEEIIEEYQPKRLKSVIVALIERDEPEIEEFNRDCHKDEIVYEHDDYPSKSNDSFDGVSGRDSTVFLDDAGYGKARSLEDPNRQAVGPDIRASELSEKSLEEEKIDRVVSSSVGSGVNDNVKGNENEILDVSAVSHPGNLEAILRQKALENLLKRQGKLPANISADKKGKHRSEVKSSSFLQNESVWHRIDEGSIQSAQKVGKNVEIEHIASADPLQSAEKGNASGGHAMIRHKQRLLTSTGRVLGASNTWRRELTPQESCKSSQSLSKASDLAKRLHSPGVKVVSEKVDSAIASEPSPSAGESTKIETNEDDDDSQFQQKTMTVMRGGELVQVSYKVRIPKKAPALARRQLKR